MWALRFPPQHPYISCFSSHVFRACCEVCVFSSGTSTAQLLAGCVGHVPLSLETVHSLASVPIFQKWLSHQAPWKPSQQPLFPCRTADCTVMPAMTLASLAELGGLANEMSHTLAPPDFSDAM